MDLKGRKEGGGGGYGEHKKSSGLTLIRTHLAGLSTYLSFYDILRNILLIQVYVVAGTTQMDFAAFLLLSVILGRVSQIPWSGGGTQKKFE